MDQQQGFFQVVSWRLYRPVQIVLVLAALSISQPVQCWAQSAQAPLSNGLTSAGAGPLPIQVGAASPYALPAISDTTNPAAAMDSVLQSPLFGALPFRQDLQTKGVDFTAHYIIETMSSTAGFKGTGTDYAQQVDFGLAFDLDKLGIWQDAIARFAMTDRADRSTAADYTGSCFAYQEIFGQGQNLRFNEITIEKFLLSQEVAIKAGFYPMGNDFSTLPYVCNFVNVAFCGHPQSLPTDSGWSDAPAGRRAGASNGMSQTNSHSKRASLT